VLERRLERSRVFREAQYSEERTALEGLPTTDTKNFLIFKNVRSDIGYSIQCDWVKDEDVITFRHIPGLTLNEETGRIKAGYYGRSDILQVTWIGHGHASVDPSDHAEAGYTVQVSPGHDVEELTDAEAAYLRAAAELLVERNREYVDHELRFFAEKVWQQLDGMTPEQAIVWLETNGWYERVNV